MDCTGSLSGGGGVKHGGGRFLIWDGHGRGASRVINHVPTPIELHFFTSPWYKAFTGTVPFSDHKSPIIAIIDGKRPPRPRDLEQRLWELMQKCWDHNRRKRPPMLEVLLTLSPLVHERTHPSVSLTVTADVQTPVSDIQQRLEDPNTPRDEYRPLLYALLSHRGLEQRVVDLQGGDLQRFIELLDKVGTADIHPYPY